MIWWKYKNKSREKRGNYKYSSLIDILYNIIILLFILKATYAITSNTKASGIYGSHTQKETNKIFDEDLKNTSENDINEVKNNNNGKFVRYLEHHNSFKDINSNDLSFFKEILWDNKITDEEYESIPYES